MKRFWKLLWAAAGCFVSMELTLTYYRSVQEKLPLSVQFIIAFISIGFWMIALSNLKEYFKTNTNGKQ